MTIPNEVVLPCDAERKFSSHDEAKLAFINGQLPWREGSVAYMLVLQKDDSSGQVVGGSHKRVEVLDVNDIEADRRPVYCVKDGSGRIHMAEERCLFTRLALFGTDEQPTKYGKWVREQHSAWRRDLAAGIRTKITFKVVFDEPKAETSAAKRAKRAKA